MQTRPEPFAGQSGFQDGAGKWHRRHCHKRRGEEVWDGLLRSTTYYKNAAQGQVSRHVSSRSRTPESLQVHVYKILTTKKPYSKMLTELEVFKNITFQLFNP